MNCAPSTSAMTESKVSVCVYVRVFVIETSGNISYFATTESLPRYIFSRHTLHKAVQLDLKALGHYKG